MLAPKFEKFEKFQTIERPSSDGFQWSMEEAVGKWMDFFASEWNIE